MYDLIIIGGGPAGLTAAIYAIRKRLNVLILTEDMGGKTNYRLALPWMQDYQAHHIVCGQEIIDKFRDELEYLHFARRMEAVKIVSRQNGHFVAVTASGAELEAASVIVATGARQVRMGVPGEKEFTMKGLCYSALSYAPLFIDKTAIVVGDKDLALRSAAELATIAQRVYLVCNNDKAFETPLGKKLQGSEKVSLLRHLEIVEVKGGEYAHALTLKDDQGRTRDYDADGIFVEKALIPNSEIVKSLVNLDESGRIIVDGANQTSVPGVFAAGDVTTDFAEQVLIAVSAGAKAALNAYDYLLPRL